jgi:hypothetical protein
MCQSLVRALSSRHSSTSTIGTAWAVEQHTGWPLLWGAHIRPQSTDDSGARKPS